MRRCSIYFITSFPPNNKILQQAGEKLSTRQERCMCTCFVSTEENRKIEAAGGKKRENHKQQTWNHRKRKAAKPPPWNDKACKLMWRNEELLWATKYTSNPPLKYPTGNKKTQMFSHSITLQIHENPRMQQGLAWGSLHFLHIFNYTKQEVRVKANKRKLKCRIRCVLLQ